MKELKKSVLYQTLEKCKSVFWFVFWFSSAINILALFLPLYTSQVLDRVLSSGSASTLAMLSIVTISALACSALLDVCRSLTMAKVADWIDRETTPDLIVRAISLTSMKGSSTSGDVIRDLGTVKGFITGVGIFSLFDMPWAFVYLVAIFMIHPVTGCIAVVGIVLLVLMAVWNEMATKRVMQESTEENVRNIGYIDVASRNAEVVEAMGMIKHIVTEWSKRNDQNRSLQVKAQGRSNAILGVTRFTRSVLQIAVIGVGAWLAIHGHKTAGGIIASSILMGRALAPFEASINTWKMLQSARISYRRLQTLLLAAPQRDQAMSLPAPRGAISLERVFFTPYGGMKPTIKGVSFVVEPGSSVGIIGVSASGKSTLVKLLVGVWKPISGVVRLDGADVYTWNREDFGRHVGYLPQDVELFNASIKTNIARMMPDADPEKVIKAAMIAGIHEMILQLPNGYDTIIGSGGVVLSGGQKQMLGLARAFYGDVKLLVLDEPNANLDGKAEANLMQALRYAKQRGITTFVVTHKVQLLNAVDQVVVMDDGMLSAMGSKDEILSKFSARPPTAPSNQVTKPPLPPAAPKQESGTAVVKSDGTTAAGVSRQEPVNRVAVTEGKNTAAAVSVQGNQGVGAASSAVPQQVPTGSSVATSQQSTAPSNQVTKPPLPAAAPKQESGPAVVKSDANPAATVSKQEPVNRVAVTEGKSTAAATVSVQGNQGVGAASSAVPRQVPTGSSVATSQQSTAPSNQVTKPPLPPAAPKQESGTAVVKSDGTTAAGVPKHEPVNRVAVTEGKSTAAATVSVQSSQSVGVPRQVPTGSSVATSQQSTAPNNQVTKPPLPPTAPKQESGPAVVKSDANSAATVSKQEPVNREAVTEGKNTAAAVSVQGNQGVGAASSAVPKQVPTGSSVATSQQSTAPNNQVTKSPLPTSSPKQESGPAVVKSDANPAATVSKQEPVNGVAVTEGQNTAAAVSVQGNQGVGAVSSAVPKQVPTGSSVAASKQSTAPNNQVTKSPLPTSSPKQESEQTVVKSDANSAATVSKHEPVNRVAVTEGKNTAAATVSVQSNQGVGAASSTVPRQVPTGSSVAISQQSTAPNNQVTKSPLPTSSPKQESEKTVVKSDGTTAAGVSRQEPVNRVAVTESDSAVTNTHAEQEGTVEKEKVTDSRVVGAAKIRVRRYGASNASNPLRERRRRTYGKQATPDQVSDSSRVVISDHNADGKSAGVAKKRRYGNSKSRKIAGTQETNRGKKATSTDDVPIGD
ncbi:type I secretion system permease/ATPase [Anaplasma phagocytophilum]|uniref:type I secretion system permease/ATPase n=1 Tax=Anaplasma phagocytophilum TaxID=948 RepID=UPI002155D977|nr:type I secretion system permease/ATPase [Anaplasma phagocytophilum]